MTAKDPLLETFGVKDSDIDNLTRGLALSAAEQDELLADLPAEFQSTADTLVVTSIRLPLSTLTQMKQYAERHGTAVSVLVRQWIELHLADEFDRPVNLSDVLRAVASLPKAA